MSTTPMIAGREISKKYVPVFEGLRIISLIRYRGNTYRSFVAYMKRNYGVCQYRKGLRIRTRTQDLKRLFGEEMSKEWIQELKVGTQALEKVMRSSFWDWDRGSTLLFWRWPPEVRKEARDGVEIFVSGKLPRYRVPQTWPEEPHPKEEMIKK